MDLDADRGGPGQAPQRGPAWTAGTTDPQEAPPTRSDILEDESTLTATNGEGWRAMVRRYYKHYGSF